MRIFLIFASFLMATTFSGVVTRPNQPGAKCNGACTTAACIKEAELLRKYMDFTADPCDGFYQFVCGNYVKTVPISGDEVEVLRMAEIIGKIHIELISELKAAVKPSDSKAIKNVKTHYQNCLDEDAIEKVGDAPLVKLIDELGGWPVLRGNAWNEKDYKWQDTMSNISKQGFLPEFPFKLSVNGDFTNSSNYILQIEPAVTTIDKSYIGNGIKAYNTLMIEVAVLLGATRENATAELQECSEFEFKLYQLQFAFLNSSTPLDYRQTGKQLSDQYPDMPWMDIFNSILNPSNVNIDENETFVLQNPTFVSKVVELIGKTPKRVLANYQIWRVIYQLIDYLPRSYRNHKFNFDKVVLGYQSLPQRDQVCFNWVKPSFATVIGAMYANKYFDKRSKDRVDQMILYIRKELKFTLLKMQWMERATRQNALRKWQAMKFISGYPDEMTDDTKIENIYKDLEIIPGNFFESYRRVSNHTKNLKLNQLRKTVNETHWISKSESVTDANAFYSLGTNEIFIPAGILQEPVFKFDRPSYLNYGAVGFLVGHEIIHGFDSNGRNFDKFGNMNNWWDKITENKFEKRVDCLIDQFNGYLIKQINQKVDGYLTRNENIADGGGYKLAYHAYQNFINSTRKTEKCLPNLNYSPQQMFWISAGSTWCGKYNDQILRSSLIDDEHSPLEARVNVGMSNVQEFSDDFQCPLGSKMNPINKCIVW